MKRWNLIVAVLLVQAGASAQTYPQELYPSNATINALNGQVDSLTGLEYVPQGTNPSSTIPLPIRLNRMFNRLYGSIGAWNRGRVVQTATLRIGVFPITYTMNGARVSYAGATDQGNGSLTLGNDTYYVYLDNANALQIVTDGTGWPADITQYLPLAEVVVSGGAITSIVDRRTWAAFHIPQTGGAATTGTDSTYFILDQDNGSSGADVELRANRGSTGNDAALRFTGSTGAAAFYSDRDANTLAPLSSLTYTSTVSTGTAPLTVSSTTKVGNLNADATDGVSIGTPTTNGLAFGSSSSLLGFTSAPTAADVLYADGSGVPTWGALGATSGVQAYDADLAGLAAVASNGIIVRTSGGTFSPRVINAAGAISVSNGNGVAGNPTVGITSQTDRAVLLGDSSNGLTSGPVGTDNTVLVGRTGNTPTFRKILDADVDATAAIDPTKLATASPGQILVANAAGKFAAVTMSGDLTLGLSGNATVTGSVSRWQRFNVSHVNLQAAATASTYVLINPTATYDTLVLVDACLIRTATPFAGSGLVSYTISVGVDSAEEKYSTWDYDVMASTSASNYQLFWTQGAEHADSIKIYAHTSGANTNVTTAGQVTIWLRTMQWNYDTDP